MQTVSFHIDLEASQGCTVEANLEHDHAEVTRATDAQGCEVAVTLDDLDRIEEVLFPETTEVEALDFSTGRNERFTVHHSGDHVGAIINGGGYTLPLSGEQFTEAAEAFHIDREWQMMEDSDVQGYARRCYC